MPKKTSLIEQLRRSRSTAKTQLLARWPEVREALAAGFSKKDVYELLANEGLEMSYSRFAHHTAKLLEQEQPAPAVPSGVKDTTPPKPKTQTAPARRFTHKPKASKKDLI